MAGGLIMLFLIKVIKLMWHLVWLPIYAIALLLELTRDKCRAILILMQDNENAPVIKTISYII